MGNKIKESLKMEILYLKQEDDYIDVCQCFM